MNMRSSDRRAGISASLQMNHLQPLPQVYVCCYCDVWRFAADIVFFVHDGWAWRMAKFAGLSEILFIAEVVCC
jgi:hypothetical protein